MRDHVFVLVKPENPANIGAAARALKTMGHRKLALVNPVDHLCGKARALAHGSVDILEAAQVYTSLEEVPVDYLVATTARHRRNKFRYVNSGDVSSALDEKTPLLRNVGIVFGGETSGLSTADLHKCDMVSTIPNASTHPSMNLSQAVMIYAYCLSSEEQAHTHDWRVDREQAQPLEYQSLKTSVLAMLDRVSPESDEVLRRYLSKAIGRLGYDDLYLVHNLRRKIAKYMDSLGPKA